MNGDIVMIDLHRVYERYVSQLMKESFNDIAAADYTTCEINQVFLSVNAKFLSEVIAGVKTMQFKRWKGVDIAVTSSMKGNGPHVGCCDLHLWNSRAVITPEVLALILYVVSFSTKLLKAQGYAANPLRTVSDSGPLDHGSQSDDLLMSIERSSGFIFFLNAVTPRMIELVRAYLIYLSGSIGTVATNSITQVLITKSMALPWTDTFVAYLIMNFPAILQAALVLYTGGHVRQKYHNKPAFLLETVVHPVISSFVAQVMCPLFLVHLSSHRDAVGAFNLSDTILQLSQSNPTVKRLITLANVSQDNSFGFALLNLLVDDLRKEEVDHCELAVLEAVKSLGVPDNSHLPWWETERYWVGKPSSVRASLLLEQTAEGQVRDTAWSLVREFSLEHDGEVIVGWNKPNLTQDEFLGRVKRWSWLSLRARGVGEAEEGDLTLDGICVDVTTKKQHGIERMLLNRLFVEKSSLERDRRVAVAKLNKLLDIKVDQEEKSVAALYLRLAQSGYRPMCGWSLTGRDFRKIVTRRRGWPDAVASWGPTGGDVDAKRQRKQAKDVVEFSTITRSGRGAVQSEVTDEVDFDPNSL
eukprot:GHVN01051191.1.p1 GENE.GHVN01051191.1~~GHVN01051191.1.p1  ORF type:complete len:583 (-),score=50.05 GHVN01051191.1:1573-3321(-)